MGCTTHIDGHRDYILHTLIHIVHQYTQKELDQCGKFLEIYDHILKSQKPMTS